jgi:type II secretory pathway pseudopilin PulG
MHSTNSKILSPRAQHQRGLTLLRLMLLLGTIGIVLAVGARLWLAH